MTSETGTRPSATDRESLPQDRSPEGRSPRPASGRGVGRPRRSAPHRPAGRPGRERGPGRSPGSRTALLYLWGLGASGWANSLLLRRRPGRLGVVEGLLLRLLGRGQQHHRRQDRRWRSGRWPCRCGSSGCRRGASWCPRRSRASVPSGCCTRPCAVRRGPPVAALLAGAVDGADAGGGADVPLRQPRRDAGAAAGRRGVRDAPRGRGSPTGPRGAVAGVLAGALRRAGLPGQDAAGLPGAARRSSLVYAVFAAAPWRRRLGCTSSPRRRRWSLAAGWWVAIVELWPASSRPYIGGSQHNSILELALGYNGFGRLDGDETGSVGAAAATRWRSVGLDRARCGCSAPRSAARSPGCCRPRSCSASPAVLRAEAATPVQAALTLWLGWLVVTGATFSLMAGIFHPYYTVALAPAIAALVGIGCVGAVAAPRVAGRDGRPRLHRRADHGAGPSSCSTATLGCHPWLRYVVAVRRLRRRPPGRRCPAPAAASSPAASRRSRAAGRARRPGGVRRRRRRRRRTPAPSRARARRAAAGRPGVRPRWRRRLRRGRVGQPPGGGNARRPAPAACSTAARRARRSPRCSRHDASSYTWVAATVGSNSAAGYQLATEQPGDADRRVQRQRPEPDAGAVPGLGGRRADPLLHRRRRRARWRAGRHRPRRGRGGPGGSSGRPPRSRPGSSRTYTAKTVDGVTVYDLSPRIVREMATCDRDVPGVRSGRRRGPTRARGLSARSTRAGRERRGSRGALSGDTGRMRRSRPAPAPRRTPPSRAPRAAPPPLSGTTSPAASAAKIRSVSAARARRTPPAARRSHRRPADQRHVALVVLHDVVEVRRHRGPQPLDADPSRRRRGPGHRSSAARRHTASRNSCLPPK